MLFVIHGSDIKKVREKAHSLTDSLLTKKPDSNVFTLTDEMFDTGQLGEFIGGSGLFESNYIVVLDTILESKHAGALLDRLADIHASSNVFLILEGKVGAKELKMLEKHAHKIQEFSEKAKVEKKEYTLFALTDALGSRNTQKIWIEYHKALLAGVSPEEIHSMLFWQVKSMILAGASKDAKESGLNPFVHKKALSAGRNYSKDEVHTLLQNLVTIFHESRRGKDLDIALERQILSI